MRITTQMINESARKAGLPIHGNSLLNHIQKDSENSLFGGLNENIYSTNTSNLVNSVRKNSYEKLEKSADKLLEIAEKFTLEGEESLFEKAKESKDNQQIYDTAKSLVEKYNTTIEDLKSASTQLNDYYRQMLEEVVEENSASLSQVGITLSSDGTLSLDETKMKSADMESLENAFGTSSTFSSKVAFLASRISLNAETNMSSLSSQYGSSADIYSLLNSKFDLWG